MHILKLHTFLFRIEPIQCKCELNVCMVDVIDGYGHVVTRCLEMMPIANFTSMDTLVHTIIKIHVNIVVQYALLR